MRRRTHYVTTNVSSIRDYFPGDSFNRIHWPSTARTGRIMVKEFELDPTADLWLFLDMQGAVQADRLIEDGEGTLPPLWPTRPTLAPSTEEYVVTIGASLAKHFLTRSRAVGVVAYSQKREVLVPDRGERQLTKIMEMLAVIRAKGTVPLAQVIAAEGKNMGRNTSVVVITPSDDLRWVENLRDLSRKGIRSIGVVTDTSSFGGKAGADTVISTLRHNGIQAYRVREGDDLSAVLGQPSAQLA